MAMDHDQMQKAFKEHFTKDKLKEMWNSADNPNDYVQSFPPQDGVPDYYKQQLEQTKQLQQSEIDAQKLAQILQWQQSDLGKPYPLPKVGSGGSTNDQWGTYIPFPSGKKGDSLGGLDKILNNFEKNKPKSKPNPNNCPSCGKPLYNDVAENVKWCNKKDCDFPWVVDNVVLIDIPDPSDPRTHLGTIFEYYDLAREDTEDEVSNVS